MKPNDISFFKRNRIPVQESAKAVTVQGIKGVLREHDVIALRKQGSVNFELIFTVRQLRCISLQDSFTV